MSTIYIVDGSGYIFRAYYAVQSLSTKAGFPTNALFGFTRMMLKLLRDKQPTYLAVTFDCREPTFRHELYHDYKANRIECPQDLQQQMPYFRKVVDALGIAYFEKPGFEADDIIATIVRRSEQLGNEIEIISGDKDLTQLVDEHCSVYDAMRDIRYDIPGVEQKFGVKPSQMLDYLTLLGDSSDNVPGVKGVGEKTAQKLISTFGSIPELLANLDQVKNIQGLRGAATIASKIELSQEQLRLSRSLIALDDQVLPFSEMNTLEALHYHNPDPDKLVALFRELEFEKLLEDYAVLFRGTDAVRSGNQSSASSKQFTCLAPSDLAKFAGELSQCKEFAFDTETTGLDPLTSELVGISFSWRSGVATYVPISHRDIENNIPLEDVREALGPIFADASIRKVGLNLKYDIRVLLAHGMPVQGLEFDSMLAAFVSNPDRRQYGLKHLTKTFLHESMQTFEEVLGDAESLAQLPASAVAPYACHDAEASWNLWPIMSRELGEGGNPSPKFAFENVEMPLVEVLAAIEQVGIGVDEKYLAELEVGFTGELKLLETKIYELAGGEFNINSPKQLSQVLFEKLQLPTQGLRKTNTGYSTNASVLQKFSGEFEIVDHLLEYRELFKLKTTYVEALQRLVNPKTGRIHSTFHQTGAATGRLSSSDPNLQNIPIRNERGRLIRQAFRPREGAVFLSADYSQIELRVLAHLSGDENLRNTFLRNEDIHLATARDIFGERSDDEMKHFRRIAKTINFGVIYGISAFRLANELGISRREAQTYIDNYFQKFPLVQQYFDRVIEDSQAHGFVQTLLGHRRYTKDIDATGRDPGYVQRSLLNAPIQGTAAEIIKLAMIQVFRGLGQFQDAVQLVLQVHDELLFEVDKRVIERVREFVVGEMENCITLSVPLRVDVHVGDRWGGDS